MNKEIETTWANKILFFLLCATIIFTTLAYGTVHQPTIAVFYLIVVFVIILWAIDAFQSGVLRFNKNLLQVPLAATILFGIFQIIPFGSWVETAGVAGISRTISLDPYWTKMVTVHFFALLIFFAAFLA